MTYLYAPRRPTTKTNLDILFLAKTPFRNVAQNKDFINIIEMQEPAVKEYLLILYFVLYFAIKYIQFSYAWEIIVVNFNWTWMILPPETL